MKKILMVLALSLIAFDANASSRPDYEFWRSTEISVADTDVAVTTGDAAVYIYKIETTSGSVPFSSFTYFNSSSSVNSGGSVYRSTSVAYDVSVAGREWEVREVLTRGFRYTKTGTGVLRVLWNWVGQTPKGQEGRGIK